MNVVDTSAMVALIDASDTYHRTVRTIYEDDPGLWILPWAILPEVDYIVTTRIGADPAAAFRHDLANGSLLVERGTSEDFTRAVELNEQYRDLSLGLVDAIVAATAERLRASAIVTLDLRDFAPLKLKGAPLLLPRDRRQARKL